MINDKRIGKNQKHNEQIPKSGQDCWLCAQYDKPARTPKAPSISAINQDKEAPQRTYSEKKTWEGIRGLLVRRNNGDFTMKE
ncbi:MULTISPECIES: hypothetical protein [Yersinia]|uniref:hypothetical protein n=1 Tax=Yersinia TaxID=629 RepID=UPI000C53154D|nr:MULTISPECIES: hypothetical protein [Yersinia]PHZ21447.1 hypothetical protein CS535_22570 [Yersinia massiliensis]